MCLEFGVHSIQLSIVWYGCQDFLPPLRLADHNCAARRQSPHEHIQRVVHVINAFVREIGAQVHNLNCRIE